MKVSKPGEFKKKITGYAGKVKPMIGSRFHSMELEPLLR